MQTEREIDGCEFVDVGDVINTIPIANTATCEMRTHRKISCAKSLRVQSTHRRHRWREMCDSF